jgi:hypothetical protein
MPVALSVACGGKVSGLAVDAVGRDEGFTPR